MPTSSATTSPTTSPSPVESAAVSSSPSAAVATSSVAEQPPLTPQPTPMPGKPGADVAAEGDGSGARAWLWILAVLAVVFALAAFARRLMSAQGSTVGPAPASTAVPPPEALEPPALAWTDLSEADRLAFEQAARDLGLGGPP